MRDEGLRSQNSIENGTITPVNKTRESPGEQWKSSWSPHSFKDEISIPFFRRAYDPNPNSNHNPKLEVTYIRVELVGVDSSGVLSDRARLLHLRLGALIPAQVT